MNTAPNSSPAVLLMLPSDRSMEPQFFLLQIARSLYGKNDVRSGSLIEGKLMMVFWRALLRGCPQSRSFSLLAIMEAYNSKVPLTRQWGVGPARGL